MKRFPEINRVRLGTDATVALCFFLLGFGTTPTRSPIVIHVILIWMKHPGRSADRTRLKWAGHSLRVILGVLRVETSRTISALPPGFDRSFDLGVVITFRDRVVLQSYENDPRHLDAMRRYLRPIVQRYEVYNLGGC